MIRDYKKITEDTLLKYFDEILNNKEHLYAKKTIESMKYTTCLGGKRLRAILCLEACRLVSGDFLNAVPSACALEMLHAQSLIHDDLPSMDNDDLRRGKPSNHKVYGEATAILSGDALISLGAQTIIDKTKNVNPENIISAVSEYLKAAGIFGIVGGQTADLEAEDINLKSRNNEDYIEYIQKYKTGALFEASCVIGAIIGNGTKEQINILRNFSQSFGLAFQMADDILDVISTTETMGKTTGKDDYENKLTYDILKQNNMDSIVFTEIIESITKRIFGV